VKEACLNRPNGPLILAEEFSKRLAPDWREKGYRFFCPACGQEVHPYGVYSPRPETPRRFDHCNAPEDLSPFDDCTLANRLHGQGLPPPLGWDFEQSGNRKREFLDIGMDLAVRSYLVCHHLCGAGNLSTSKYLALVERSQQHNIWAYKDLQMWMLPFVFVLLDQFQTESEKAFHFALLRNGKARQKFWTAPHHFEVQKVFSDSNKPMSHGLVRSAISEHLWSYISQKTSWLSTPARVKIMRGCERILNI